MLKRPLLRPTAVSKSAIANEQKTAFNRDIDNLKRQQKHLQTAEVEAKDPVKAILKVKGRWLGAKLVEMITRK